MVMIKSILTGLKKPDAFKDRTDIEYVSIEFEHIEFINWGVHKISSVFQIPTGFRDLSALLHHYFTHIMRMNRVTVLISKEIYDTCGFRFIGGVLKNSNDCTFVKWEKYEYIKYCKDKKMKKN